MSTTTPRLGWGVMWGHTQRLPVLLRETALKALEHDSLNLAQSAAYSSIIALFPAMIVLAAMIALLPDVAPLKVEIGEFFNEVLPTSAFSLLTSYFVSDPGTSHVHTVRSLVLAGIVSVSGGSSVIMTLMEGVRRAQGWPKNCWKGWEQRRQALLLVPLSLLPLALATLLVVFGRIITDWAMRGICTAGCSRCSMRRRWWCGGACRWQAWRG